MVNKMYLQTLSSDLKSCMHLLLIQQFHISQWNATNFCYYETLLRYAPLPMQCQVLLSQLMYVVCETEFWFVFWLNWMNIGFLTVWLKSYSAVYPGCVTKNLARKISWEGCFRPCSSFCSKFNKKLFLLSVFFFNSNMTSIRFTWNNVDILGVPCIYLHSHINNTVATWELWGITRSAILYRHYSPGKFSEAFVLSCLS